MDIAVSLVLIGGRLSEHLLVSNHGHLTVWMPVPRGGWRPLLFIYQELRIYPVHRINKKDEKEMS